MLYSTAQRHVVLGPTQKPPTGICSIMDLLCQAFVIIWKKKAFWIITVGDPAVDILASLEQKQ